MLEKNFIDEVVWPGLDNASRALFRSQHGPLASALFTALPTSRVTRVDAQPFRLLLCRRPNLPLLLSMRTCRCGRQLDVFGHHGAACAMAGVLGRRGTEAPGGGLQTMTVLQVARRRKERTYPELVGEVKWAADGAKKLPLSSLPWPRRVLSLLLSFCRVGSKLR